MPGDKPYYEKNDYTPSHITVDIMGQNVGRTGGNLSSRQKITIVNDRGNQVQGFFTANETVNAKDDFAEKCRNINNEDLFKPFLPVYDLIMNKNQDLSKTLKEIHKVIGVNFPDDFKDLNKINLMSNSPENRVSDSDKARKSFLSWLALNGVDRTLLEANKENNMFIGYLNELICNSESAVYLTEIHRSIHKQSLNSSVNRRNNAMYDYASLLGEPDLLAKSSNMTVVSNGQQINGSFMINARGQSKDTWKPENPQFDLDRNGNKMRSREMVLSPEAMQQISKMQVLDFLCGNIDRHPGNIFYQMDTSQKNVITIKGVQGIDNDASFGVVSFKGTGANIYMSRLDDIKIIDSKLADNILRITPEQIEEKIRLAGLSKEELAAAQERLAALKESIQSGKIQRINDMNTWKSLVDPSNDSPANHISKLRTNKGGYNIFDNVMFEVDRYNERRHDYMAKSPEEYRKAYKGDLYKPERSQFTVGTISNIEDSYNLKNQLERLEELDKAFIKTDVKSNSPEFQDMYDKMTKVMEHMRSFVKNGRMNDMQRNLVSEELKDLKKYADIYISKKNPHFGRGKERLHIAKNLSAQIEPMRRGIQRDAMEAEMNLASKKAYEIYREKGEGKTIQENHIGQMRSFALKYSTLLNNYKKSVSEKNDKLTESSIKALLESKDGFVKDFRDIASISDKYPENDEMQIALDSSLAGSKIVNDYMKTVKKLMVNQGLAKKETSLLECVGLNNDDMNTSIAIEKKAKNAKIAMENKKKIDDAVKNNTANKSNAGPLIS